VKGVGVRLFAERGSLEESARGSLPCLWDDLLSLGQAEPGDNSSLIRSANSLDKAPLVLILFDHANGLPQSNGKLIAQGWNI